MEKVKTKKELLHEMQNVADEIALKKEEVFLILNVIDELEAKYHALAEQIKNNS